MPYLILVSSLWMSIKCYKDYIHGDMNVATLISNTETTKDFFIYLSSILDLHIISF